MARLNEADLKKNISIILRETESSSDIDKQTVRDSCDEIKEYFDKIKYEDPRIGMPNLPYFVSLLDDFIIKGSISEFGACYFNLKDFTQINRQYGQTEGTKIMARFFHGLQNELGEDGYVCSAGGDSGIVLFKTNKLDVVLEHLHGKKIPVQGKENAWIEAVAGYNINLGNFSNSGDVMNTLSPTMSIAKNIQKVPEVFFTADLEKEVEEGKKILRNFPEALQDEEFMVYFQPKVELRGYSLAGAEALCRWKHNGKMIFPDQFIPVFENDGIAIRKLDFYMLDLVCKEIKKWIDDRMEPVQVSVNLSRCHLGNPRLIDDIVKIIDENKVPRKYIQIELTETTTDVDFQVLKELVTGLQIRGISTAIDDFGTGYSSITILKDLPWKVLKIDKSFLKNAALGGDNNDEVILRHVISLCQELGIECIAEGVETSDNVRLLKANDCYLAQGYYFDKPLPADKFREKLQERTREIRNLLD